MNGEQFDSFGKSRPKFIGLVLSSSVITSYSIHSSDQTRLNININSETFGEYKVEV